MNKIIMFLALALFSMTAVAAEKGEIYLGPVIGYHFFDNDQKLDDKIEGGLRYGYFITDSISLEAEADYTRTEYDNGNNKDVTSLFLQAVKFFDLSYYYKPFVFIGAGGMFAEDDMAAIVGGIGARFIANERISFDLRVKDMYLSKEGRNDVIPSVSLNYHFGKAGKAYSAPEKSMEAEPVAEAAPAAKTMTEEKTAPVSIEKKEAAAVAERTDSDGDGIYDDEDICLNTPKGYPVDGKGCTPDSDGDGVYDFEDRCPGTLKGMKVNSAGCFISMTLNVNFKTESDKIEDKYLVEIREFANFLKSSPPVKIEIQGHADSRGTDAYNMALSKKRAESVARILSNNYSVDKNKISTVGFGESRPLVPNDSPENMRKNRRIDTVVK